MRQSEQTLHWSELNPVQKLLVAVLFLTTSLAVIAAVRASLGPAPTVNRVVFHPTGGIAFNKGEEIVMQLPRGWRAHYNGRQPWREATICNSNNEPQWEVTADLASGAPYESPQGILDGFSRRASIPDGVRDSVREFRNSPRGQVWVWRFVEGNRQEYVFLNPRGQTKVNPAVTLYALAWRDKILHMRFRTLPEKADDLDPIAWKVVSSTKLKG